jgi:hypothetical protein
MGLGTREKQGEPLLLFTLTQILPVAETGGWMQPALKGTVSRDFLLLVLFMNQFPPNPTVFH